MPKTATAIIHGLRRGALEVRGVDLWWPHQEGPVLAIHWLTVKPGDRAAVFGGVASGKSSLLLGLLAGECAERLGGLGV